MVTGVWHILHLFEARDRVKVDSIHSLVQRLEANLPLPHVFLLIGKARQDLDAAVRAIKRSVFSANSEKQGTITTLDAKELQRFDLLGWANPSLIHLTNLLIIDGVDRLSPPSSLIDFLNSPSDQRYMILTALSRPTTQLVESVERVGVVLALRELKAWEKEKILLEWLQQQCSARQKRLSHRAKLHLVEASQHDPLLLEQEFEKCVLFAGPQEEITDEDLACLTPSSNSETVWQLGDALLEQQTPRALRLGELLLKAQPGSLILILKQLKAHLITNYEIAALVLGGASKDAISQRFPYLKGKFLEARCNAARAYPIDAYLDALLAVAEAEQSSKNSSIDEQFLMLQMVLKISLPQPARYVHES